MKGPKKAARKPVAQKLAWELRKTEVIHQGKTFLLRRDTLDLPKRDEPLVYEYEERAPAVIVVPVTKAGEIVLIRQYRYPVDAWCLETPAGGCHDTGDRALEEVVRKELKEEIGATAGEIEKVARFFSAPSFSDEVAHIFIAWDVEMERRPEPESTEQIRVELMPAGEAMQKARAGELVTAQCALALFLCEPQLQARGVETA
jgi:ADP-ribose pyrophosphatase